MVARSYYQQLSLCLSGFDPQTGLFTFRLSYGLKLGYFRLAVSRSQAITEYLFC